MADVFSQDQTSKFRLVFEQFDKSGDGNISAKELRNVLRQLGQNADTKSCKKIIKMYDKNKSNRMEFKEFLDMMANVFQYHLCNPEASSETKTANAERKAKIEDLFNSLDADESGYIDADEIVKLTESLGEKLTLEEVHEMIEQVDKDGDGKVNKEEFVRLMASN